MDNIIKRPLLTEKSSIEKEMNKYFFEVAVNASKPQIKKIVETRFGVKVSKVNTLINAGKYKKFGKATGKTKKWKKAVVTLKEGSIALFEGV